jgi:hypothetical protein
MCLAIAAGLTACGGGGLKPGYSGPPNASKCLLIVAMSGDFKIDVAERVRDAMTAEGWGVNLMALNDATSEEVDNHDATLLINTCWAWRLHPSARGFVTGLSPEQKSRIVHLTTTADPDSKVETLGLDGITGASKKLDPAHTAQALVERIKKAAAEDSEAR